MANDQYDIAIVGGGMGGLALALKLSRAGLRVVLLERQPSITTARRGELLQPNGLKVLDRLGLLPGVLALPVHRNERFHFHRIGRGRLLTVDYRELPPPINYSLVTLPQHLMGLFERELRREPNMTLLLETAMVELWREDGRVAGLVAAHGAERWRIRARMVVGSDGAFSQVRRAAGIAARTHVYADAYLTLVVPRPPGFDRDARYYVGRRQILGAFPVNDHELYLFYMIRARDREAHRRAGLERLRHSIGAIDAALVPAVETVRDWESVGYMPCVRVRARTWVGDRVALIADAAHAMNPHVAQGRNQALEDALTLGERILDCARRDTWDAASLAPYERSRRPQVTLLQRQGDEMELFWNSGWWPLTWLRDRSFARIEANPRLRRQVLALIAGMSDRPLSWCDRLIAAGVLPEMSRAPIRTH